MVRLSTSYLRSQRNTWHNRTGFQYQVLVLSLTCPWNQARHDGLRHLQLAQNALVRSSTFSRSLSPNRMWSVKSEIVSYRFRRWLENEQNENKWKGKGGGRRELISKQRLAKVDGKIPRWGPTKMPQIDLPATRGTLEEAYHLNHSHTLIFVAI